MAAEQEHGVSPAELVYEEDVEEEADALETSKNTGKQEKSSPHKGGSTSSFVHGLAVGLGIGCIAAFVMTWLTVFFTPQLPTTVTYEALLSIFIYPLLYLLAVGLVTLTAGVVREYYSIRN
jgi:threonine/homoserine/homoserine lactone efflux protein